MNRILTAIGLMSGTSMDGIDVALIKTDGESVVDCGPTAEFPYDGDIRQRIVAALQEAKFLTHASERTQGLADLEQDLTQLHGKAVLEFLSANKLAPKYVDLIGFHGQTLVHRPAEGLSVQIGHGAMLSEICGIDTVFDLRQNDLANGGQGAPLVPVFHQALGEQLAQALSIQLPVAFVNIGGISNVTYVDAGTDPIAFDCGPGNNLIDQWVSTHSDNVMDKGGDLGLCGRVHEDVVERYMAHQYFDQAPPKSLDRSDFEPLDADSLSLEDGAATLAALTARTIFTSAKHFPKQPLRWIISGGGVHNRAILLELERLSGEQGAVASSASVGLDANFMEAQAWGYLAVRSVKGLALTFPSTTGVRKAVSGGMIVRSNR